jgi:hypothetical protein
MRGHRRLWVISRVLFGVFGEEGVGGDEAFAEGEVGGGEFGFVDDLLEGTDDGDGVHVVEEADVGDAEELALPLALAVGDDGGELRFEAIEVEEAFGVAIGWSADTLR